jgi:glycosyltransferase involved in cell wall biosynthesis
MLDAWQGLEVPLRIVGDGPLMDEVVKRQTPWIEVLGSLPHDDVQHLMRRSAFLIFPSLWYEGMPMTIIEAFRASLPVIASRLGVMTEMIEEGRTGLHFTAGHSNELQANVRWAIQNAATMRGFGHAAFRAFTANYTSERNYETLLTIYRAAMGREQKPDAFTGCATRFRNDHFAGTV